MYQVFSKLREIVICASDVQVVTLEAEQGRWIALCVLSGTTVKWVDVPLLYQLKNSLLWYYPGFIVQYLQDTLYLIQVNCNQWIFTLCTVFSDKSKWQHLTICVRGLFELPIEYCKLIKCIKPGFLVEGLICKFLHFAIPFHFDNLDTYVLFLQNWLRPIKTVTIILWKTYMNRFKVSDDLLHMFFYLKRQVQPIRCAVRVTTHVLQVQRPRWNAALYGSWNMEMNAICRLP